MFHVKHSGGSVWRGILAGVAGLDIWAGFYFLGFWRVWLGDKLGRHPSNTSKQDIQARHPSKTSKQDIQARHWP